MRYPVQTKVNWVAIAVREVGGIFEAARICKVRPVVMKRWYFRRCVQLVDSALALAKASGVWVIRLIGFTPNLGRHPRLVRRRIRPTAQRRALRFVLSDTRRGWRNYGAAVWVER